MSKMDRILETLPLVGKNHPYTVYTLGRVTYQKNPEMFNEIAKSFRILDSCGLVQVNWKIN